MTDLQDDLRKLWNAWKKAEASLEMLPKHNPVAPPDEEFEADANRRLAMLAVTRTEAHYKRALEYASEGGVDHL